MNVFDKLAAAQFEGVFALGSPLGDSGAIERRMNALAQATDGKGFRLYPGKPVRTVAGKTRAERKAERIERAASATALYHANLKAARDQGLIGISYVSPDRVAKLLSEHASVPVEKPKRKSRAKKVSAEA
jgi:hypothetical protein